MKKVVVSDIFDLASRMLEKVDKCDRISAVLFGEEAFDLMRELLSCDMISVGSIDIANANIEYNLEYYVTIKCDDMTLWIEPAWINDSEYNKAGYLRNFADILYIDGSASYAIVKAQDNPDCSIYQLEFCDEYYDCSECEEHDDCEYSEEDDDMDDDGLLSELISNLIGFFDDLIEAIDSADEEIADYSKVKSDEIQDFINRKFKDKSVWLSENCYYFSVILKDRFPGGKIVYDVVEGHFSYLYDGKYYDQTGVISPGKDDVVDWDTFDEYDCIQKKRIIRDCIK